MSFLEFSTINVVSSILRNNLVVKPVPENAELSVAIFLKSKHCIRGYPIKLKTILPWRRKYLILCIETLMQEKGQVCVRMCSTFKFRRMVREKVLKHR